MTCDDHKELLLRCELEMQFLFNDKISPQSPRVETINHHFNCTSAAAAEAEAKAAPYQPTNGDRG